MIPASSPGSSCSSTAAPRRSSLMFRPRAPRKQVTRHCTPSPSGGMRRSRRSAPGRGSSLAGPYWHQPMGSPPSYARMPCARPASTSARFSAWFCTRADARSGNILPSRWQPRWYSMQAQNAHQRPGLSMRALDRRRWGVAVDAPSVRQWGRVLNLTSPDTAGLPAASRDLIRK